MNKKFKLLSFLATTTVAATLCAAGTTAFAATSVETLTPGGNVMVEASSATPAEITLDITQAYNYLFAVEPWVPDVRTAVPFTVTVDDGDDETKDAVTTTLVQNAYMFGAFTAELNLTSASKRLVLTTGSEETIQLSTTLYAPVEKPAPLPVDGKSETLTISTEYTYSYEFTRATGYYTMDWATETTGAEFAVAEKARPEYLTGTTVQDSSYPLYFVQGTTYYFTVVYTGVENQEIEEADVTFSFQPWTASEIGFNNRVYVPITPAGDTLARRIIPFAEDMTPDTYLLRLNTEPVYPEGTEIIAHMVNSDGTEVEVAPTSQFNNLYQVTLTANTTGVYFTSTFNEVFVGSVVADTTPSDAVNFTVDKEAEVKLKRNEALTCFLMDVTESGTYDITLTFAEGTESHVSVYDAYDTIVPEGATSGTFAVVLEYPNVYGFEGETTKNAAITFLNNSTEAITFYATITKSEVNYNVELDKATTLQAPAHSSIVYYVPGLTGTLYDVELTNAGKDVRVYDYFDRYEPIVDATKPVGMYSFGDISFTKVGKITYAFVVVNESDTAEELTITFTELNALYLDKQTPVEVAKEENYYMLNATAGRYMITLSDISEGADYTVSYNNTAITFDNEHVGYFNVTVPEGYTDITVILTVKNNSKEQSVKFNAVVTATPDGTMTLGVAQTVTLGYNDASETYAIELKSGVEYKITVEGTIPAGVTYYALVNDTYVLYSTNEATFTLTEDATSIQFGYFFFNETYFTLTVTITENVVG